MNHLFVNYDISKQLKALGFDEPCMTYYNSGQMQGLTWDYANAEFNKYSSRSKKWVSAPTYQQVVDWFREKHNVFIDVWFDSTQTEELPYVYELYDKYNMPLNTAENTYDTYYAAYNAAIDEAIKLVTK